MKYLAALTVLALAGCQTKAAPKPTVLREAITVKPALVIPPKPWQLTWDYNTNGVVFDIQQSTNLIDWYDVATNLQWETNWPFYNDLPAKYFRLCVPLQ